MPQKKENTTKKQTPDELTEPKKGKAVSKEKTVPAAKEKKTAAKGNEPRKPDYPVDMRPVKNTKGGMVILILLILAFFGAVGYYVYNNQDDTIYQLRQFWNALRGRIPEKPNLKPDIAPATVLTANSQYPHLKYGVPGHAIILDTPGFAVGFYNKYKQPAWVIYQITEEQQKKRLVTKDPALHEATESNLACATPTDYIKAKFRPVFFAPPEDMRYSEAAFKESVKMTNTAPMHPALFNGPWKALEKQVRHLVQSEKELYIISGPIFTVVPGTRKTVGTRQVPVPEFFYKVIYSTRENGKIIGFLFPNNEKCLQKNLLDYVVDASTLEKLTGLNFVGTVPEPQRTKMKRVASVSDWYWTQDYK